MNLKIRKMSIRNFPLVVLVLFLGAVLFSCKKEEEETSLEYMDGSMIFSIPTYVMPGQQFHLVPSGVTIPDGTVPGIYWTGTILGNTRDTTRVLNGTGDGSIDVLVPEEETSVSVSCVAFADGYYASSKTVNLVVVKGAESISGLNLPADVAMLTDSRDERTYPYVPIGSRDWMARNLAYGSGMNYYDADAMQDVFGMYYTWDEAMAACPEGWRLPTADDWSDLARAHGYSGTEDTFAGIGGKMMADAYLNDSKMWEFWPEVKITNSLHFCALPVGYAIDAEGTARFRGSSDYAVFWTAEEADEEMAYVRQLYVRSEDVYKASLHKSSFRANVRCVRDIQE